MKIAFAIVSSAENSSLNFKEQYSYIENIGDGRGYTGGIIGFTSGTGDMLEVVEQYIALKPQNNPLEQYLPALRAVNGTDSVAGLGSNYMRAWRNAAKDQEMIDAQNKIVREWYLHPAVADAQTDGLSILGQFIYYDAMVMHGPGNDSESFGGIRKAAQRAALTPAKGGNEADYLKAFIEARKKIMLLEEAHEDLSRLNAQLKFINEGNYEMKLPLTWTMYGDSFTLTQSILDSI
ncbi:MAG: chitosanase [Lachnospiraceae bacterium]|nr:chitosanase [Lachnospiraceae bacterium]